MRLVLVDNFVLPDGLDPSLFDVHPHLGLISIAAVAQRGGHEVTIYDPKREVRFGRRLMTVISTVEQLKIFWSRFPTRWDLPPLDAASCLR